MPRGRWHCPSPSFHEVTFCAPTAGFPSPKSCDWVALRYRFYLDELSFYDYHVCVSCEFIYTILYVYLHTIKVRTCNSILWNFLISSWPRYPPNFPQVTHTSILLCAGWMADTLYIYKDPDIRSCPKPSKVDCAVMSPNTPCALGVTFGAWARTREARFSGIISEHKPVCSACLSCTCAYAPSNEQQKKLVPLCGASLQDMCPAYDHVCMNFW